MSASASVSVSASATVSRNILVPLVLAQFLCSFAATTMNVAISSIATDLSTTVAGVQTAITAFTLTMAALMIPGSKLTDIWGRKTCFRLGLIVYGVGAIIAALSQNLPGLIAGYSLGEGIGTALLIPPVYILATVFTTTVKQRAAAFGAISAAGGIGSAAGPLIGGLITSAASWRLAFGVQALLVLVIIYLGRTIVETPVPEPKPRFDFQGAVLSAAGLVFIVVGILQSGTYGWMPPSPVWLFAIIGAALLFWFFRHIASEERAGKQPLLSTRMFRNREANLGLITQNMQWLILLGMSFVVSVYLQTVRGYGAIQTGLILTPATVGILASSVAAGRMAQRRAQATIIRAGFVTTIVGVAVLLLLVPQSSSVWSFVPGLLLVGVGVGMMLTSSVNVVQSSFPESDQGEISGLSRSVSNLGSSLGVAIAGTVVVSRATGDSGAAYALALVVLMAFALVGLVAAIMLPVHPPAEALAAEPQLAS